MAHTKILALLSGAPSDAGVLASAFQLATATAGHVLALVPHPDPRDAVPALGEGVSGALVDQIMGVVEKESQTRGAAAKRAFEAARLAAGALLAERPADLPEGKLQLSAAFREHVGDQEGVVAGHARVADLVVVAQVAEDEGGEALLILEAALLEGARPVLVLPAKPRAGTDGAIGRRVALAWNGSAESAHALASALPLLERADMVHVLTAKTAKTAEDVGVHAVDYLGWHGVAAQVRAITPAGQSVGAALLDAARAVDADLLVLGSYGHSRLRELVLGGVTRHVLNHADLPVLMAH